MTEPSCIDISPSDLNIHYHGTRRAACETAES